MNRVGCVTSRVSPSTPFGGPTEPDPIAREGGVFGRLQGVARAQQQAGAINRMLAISGCPERLEFSRNPNADTLPRSEFGFLSLSLSPILSFSAQFMLRRIVPVLKDQVPVLPKRQESQEYIEDETQRAKFYDETVIEVFRTVRRGFWPTSIPYTDSECLLMCS
jgi:hypothetical protein